MANFEQTIYQNNFCYETVNGLFDPNRMLGIRGM